MWGLQFHPYAEQLKEVLQAAFPSATIEVVVEGMSGAQVRGEYTGRLNRACRQAKDQPYDWIIILGGTNDLGWGGQPEEIYEALRVCPFISLRCSLRASVSVFVKSCCWIISCNASDFFHIPPQDYPNVDYRRGLEYGARDRRECACSHDH